MRLVWLRWHDLHLLEEECWSLSNVGYGLRTRQVILAHKPLVIHCNLLRRSVSKFKGAASQSVSVQLWLMRTIWSMLQSTGTAASIWWDPRQSYIKGILVSPQQSAAQEPSLCIALPDRCPGDCFSEPAFQGDNPIPLPARVTSGPLLPPLSFNPISPSFRNALQPLFLPLSSGPWCPRQS